MSGVKGKSGRKRKTLTSERAIQSLTQKLPKAIQVIDDTMSGVNRERLPYEAAVEIKDSVLGKPKLQADITSKGEIGQGELVRLMQILSEGRKRLESPVIEGEYRELPEGVTKEGKDGIQRQGVTEGNDSVESREAQGVTEGVTEASKP